jgi:molecular chaperone GrpE (heat shock protein)
MTKEQYDTATEILKEIKELEGDIKRYEREIYADNVERVRQSFRAYRKNSQRRIAELKERFEKL